MDCTASFLSYAQTGYFSKIILEYIQQSPSIQPFYSHPATIEGIQSAIADRKRFATNRELLVNVLEAQYASVATSEAVKNNIELLRSDNTFTICTAHQPNIFTGPLYFVYKILHVVKLAGELKTMLPANDFIPVYYMGSEDADLDELGHIHINEEKFQWDTHQTGAVGRMKVDKPLVKLLDTISGQLLVHPYGNEIIGMVKECYKEGNSIEQATFQLVNELFAAFGLIIVLPDNKQLKASFIPVIAKELIEEFSHVAVQETVAKFPSGYKVQASGRELNMFYLKDDQRERIELENGVFSVVNTDLKFSSEEILFELNQFPERFSPNVILRPIFQEWILPNLAFIGGGGEIAYWLQLKKVFESVGVPYPVLVVRNSFMVINSEMENLVAKLKLDHAGLFQPETDLLNQLVKRETTLQLNLDKERQQLTALYQQMETVAGKIDITLASHVSALQKQALKKIAALEKKMLRAEKRKFEIQQNQLRKVKANLFPNNTLQERMDNLMLYYAKWGKEFIRMIHDHSKGLEQEFGILTVQKAIDD
ncbi:MAG: bshC [Ferruginibacter sp.]|nr:bshC [Ferruginibacter sp.]